MLKKEILQFIKVDPQDTYLLDVNWHIASNKGKSYVTRNYWDDGKYFSLRLHRVIMEAKKGQQVDHINGDGLDNRRCNLRICTQAENNYNKKPRGKYKGIRQTKYGKWETQIAKAGKKYYVGTFETIEAAAEAYNSIATQLYGSFAFINKIEKE